MIGTIDPKQRQVSVIGGGVAGLIAAHRLDRLGFDVTLYERERRAGGLIETRATPLGIAEGAIHSTLASPSVVRLFEELGVALTPVRENAKARFVYRDGKLRRIPLRLNEITTAFTRAYLVLADSKADPDRLTMEQWARRHLGSAALDFAVTPFLRGIYGAAPSEISVKAAFPQLLVPRGHSLLSLALARKVRRGRTPRRQRHPLMTACNGMQSLTDALAAQLGPRLRLGEAVTELPRRGNIVLCTPAAEASELLRPIDPETARTLRSIRYSALTAVTAFVPRAAVPEHVRGVGVLMPAREQSRQALGILFNSSAFDGRVHDERESASFTLILAGADREDAILAEIAATELREVLGVSTPPQHLEIRRWPRALPTYSPEILSAWEMARTRWCSQPGHVLFGNYTGQLSLRGMVEEVEENWATLAPLREAEGGPVN